MDSLYDEPTINAVTTLKEAAVSLADLLALPSRPAVDAWQKAVEGRLIPRLRPDFPLVAAICGARRSAQSMAGG